MIHRGLDDVPQHARGRAISVGVFDGLHRGHRRIFERLVRHAEEAGLEPAAVTFDHHPLAVLRPQEAPPYLASPDERIQALAAVGVRRVVVLPFSLEFARLSPREFAQAVLADRLGARALFEGPDFRFGRGGAGDVSALAELGREFGFSVEVVPPVLEAGEVVSSSLVRRLLQAGDVAGAARCLGRPYRLSGRVVEGDRRGRKLGFPTANVAIPRERAWPAAGVYAVLARPEGGGARIGGMANLGVRPTFGGEELRLEAHLFDWQGDLYGRSLAVDFIARLRNERKFAGAAELIEQLARDRAGALAALADFTADPRHARLT